MVSYEMFLWSIIHGTYIWDVHITYNLIWDKTVTQYDK